MNSENKAVMKALSILVERKARLEEKRKNLKEKIVTRYPYDMYGIKADMVYEKMSRQYDDEITLLRHYIAGYHDLIERVECDILKIQEKEI